MDRERALEDCDAATTSHGEIRRWVRQHGGRPAVRDDDGAATLAIDFPGTDADDLEPIGWATFFERFEAEGLAFAYAADPGDDAAETAHALVDRDRLDEVDAAPAGEARDRATVGDRSATGDRTGESAAGREGDDRSAARERAAAADANVDDHRDEPPHNS